MLSEQFRVTSNRIDPTYRKSGSDGTGVATRETLRTVRRRIGPITGLRQAMVDVFELNEISAEQISAEDSGNSPHVVLTLYFLAAVAFSLCSEVRTPESTQPGGFR